jgi:hypothetical protein
VHSTDNHDGAIALDAHDLGSSSDRHARFVLLSYRAIIVGQGGNGLLTSYSPAV